MWYPVNWYKGYYGPGMIYAGITLFSPPRERTKTMQAEIQTASFWRRAAAWFLDLILLAVITAGVMYLMSILVNYDKYSDIVNDTYVRYEEEYGVDFDLTPEAYEALSEADRKAWDDAYAALIADEEALQAYNLTVNLIMLMTTVGVLVSMLILHLLVPLLLKNGRTLGKKVMGLGVIRYDGVKMSTLQLFIRTILGRFTIETMIPVYIVLMMLWGTIGIIGPGILLLLLIIQLVCLFAGRNNAAIHDRLAGTVVVDMLCQRVFESTEELVAYTQREHAERAARQDY